ncbi:MAG TPA: hypothetical protein VF615_24490 [Longimicrobiaceae bacterium]|jgi:hypothetical protein
MAIDVKIVEILAWPAVVTFLGSFGLVMFRAQVRAFLGRTQSVGKGWLVASPVEQQALTPATPDVVGEFLDSFSAEIVRIQETTIREDLTRRQMIGHPELEKVLIRSLAATQVALNFEQIHGVIWDGQVQLLEILNTATSGMERALVERVYVEEFQAKKLFYKTIDFDTYLAWLFEKVLIREDDGMLAITLLGREYLKWIVETGKFKRGVG